MDKINIKILLITLIIIPICFVFTADSKAVSPANTSMKIVQSGKNMELDLQPLLFALDSSNILHQSFAKLNALADQLKKSKGGKILIIGHADSTGDSVYNKKLSEQRADNVKRYLVAHGVDSNKIITQGSGEENPLSSNGTREGRMLNRSVHIAHLSNGSYEPQVYPHVYLSGYGGTNSTALGEIDVLQPVYFGDKRILFVYGQGKYGNEFDSWKQDSWSGSLGLGYRQVVPFISDDNVLGGYVLTDYSRAPSGHEFWDINPGVESIGRNWDFRLNGFIPVGKSTWTDEDWADKFGDYSCVSFSGNTQYDSKLKYTEEIGYGGNAEVGYRLFSIKHMPVKVYAGGYYFKMKHNDDVIGGGGRITFQPTTYLTLKVSDTYDNHQRNVLIGGIQLYLNALSKDKRNAPVDDQDVTTRIYAPIENSLSTTSKGEGMPTAGGPDDKNSNDKPNYVDSHDHERDGIWFFSGGSSSARNNSTEDDGFLYIKDGTYEHPFDRNEFTQKMVDAIHAWMLQHQAAMPVTFYLGGQGIYGRVNADGDNDPEQINLYKGESIWGRTENFKMPAQADLRPTIDGELKLPGNNILNSIQIMAGGDNDDGAVVTAENDGILLDNTVIGLIGGFTPDINLPYYGYIGLKMNDADVVMRGSTIHLDLDDGTDNIGDVNVTGVEMEHGGTLTLSDGSTIYVTANEKTGANKSGNAFGIHADGDGEHIIIKGNHNSIIAKGEMQGGQGTYSGNGFGILMGDFYSGDSADDQYMGSSVLGNEIDINGTDNKISGESKGLGNFSGDAFGILIGMAFNNVTGYYQNKRDMMVMGNKVKVWGLHNTIEGNVDSIGNDDVYSHNDNAYGILVGFGYNRLTDNNSDVRVQNNTITIQNAIVQGIAPSGKVTINQAIDDSLNGYGVLVGDGQALTNGKNSSLNPNFSVIGNRVNIKGASTINGWSMPNIDSGLSQDIRSSGNGYGLAVGFGSAVIDDTTGAQVDVGGNFINIINSTISGKGQINDLSGATLSQNSTGAFNGFGVLVGYNDLRNFNHDKAEDEKKIHYHTTIRDNDLYAINNATIESLGGIISEQAISPTVSEGNAYGVLMGVNNGGSYNADDHYTLGNDPNFIMNTVYVKNSTIQSTVAMNNDQTNNCNSHAYGLVLLSPLANGIYDNEHQNKNAANSLTVQGSTFNIYAGEKLANGIWVAGFDGISGAGLQVINEYSVIKNGEFNEDTLKSLESNNFNITDKRDDNYGAGYAIFLDFDHKLNWNNE